jgi:glycosyltransferase involved in cell wall biosynthesis
VEKVKLLRITTVPISLQYLLGGQLTYMQKHGFEVLAVSAGGPEVAFLEKEGISHKVIPFTRSITPFQDFVCLWQLIQLIRKIRPTIVHTHTPKAGLIGMIAGWACRIPIRLHTVAGLPLMEAKGLKKWLLIKTEQITYACATRVYANSIAMRDYIISELNIRNAKLKVIGKGSSNGIDLSYFQKSVELEDEASKIRNQYGVLQDDFVYCFVGRVVKDKGIVELIRSFIEIESAERSVWLFLVGHFEDELDPLPDDLKLQIANHPKIIHCGFQLDVRPWVLASDAFVLPSYREGFPNVVLQAGALERPCIVTDINGCNEIIKNNKTGMLVPIKDIVALKEAMLYLLQNTDKGVQMGNEVKKFIVTHFDQAYIWSEILKEYKKQLAIVQISDKTRA